MATPFTINNYYFSSNIATSNGGGVLFKPNDDGQGVSLVAPTTGPITSVNLELPNATGNEGNVLKTDGSGTMSWVNSNISTRTIVSTSTYTIKSTDVQIAVTYTPTGTVTLTLPSASTLAEFSITDEGGNAGTNNITIDRDGSDTILGDTSFIINGDYNSIRLYSNGGTAWFPK